MVLQGQVCQNNRGDAKVQADALLKAQDFAEMTDNYKLKGLVYGDLGNMYKTQGQVDSSIRYFKQAYQSFVKLNDNRNSIIVLLDIGTEFLQISRFDSAKSYFLYAEKIAKHSNDTLLHSTIYRSLGSVYLKQKDFNQAIYFYKKAPKTSTELHNSNKWFLLANAYIRTGKTDSTRYCLNRVKDLHEMTPDYYQLWGILYEKEGNSAKALYYSRLATVALDSVYKRKLDVSFAGLEKKYKYQSLQLSNQKLVIRNKQNNILLLFALVVLSLATSIVLFWRYRVKNHQLEQEKNLVGKEKENNQLLEQQVKMQNILLLNVEQYRKHSLKRPNASNAKQQNISPYSESAFSRRINSMHGY